VTLVIPGTDSPLVDGETVLLLDRKKRRYLLQLEAGKEWHSHAGALQHDDLIGNVEGTTVRTNKNMELIALRPTRDDLTKKLPRGAQVIYPKDQAMIVASADVIPGCTVVEAGAGSGALTTALLAAVGPTGRVISAELRDDHADIAVKNVTRAHNGVAPEHWELRRGSVGDLLADVRAHRVILDLLDPWSWVDGAATCLAPGGILLAYMPSITQVMRLAETLFADGRWTDLNTTETLVRGWDVDGLAVRPQHRMVAHTAFLMTARRVPTRDEGGPPTPRRKADTQASRIIWHDDAPDPDADERPVHVDGRS
jgi:tRNA (adenine57-N1/adenine58-N1)-methyltransferase